MIYFLKSHRTGLVKIGRTNFFRSRYSQLSFEAKEPLEILGVVSEERFAERQLHKHFARFRVVKEWFQDDSALRKFVAEHATLEFEAADSPRNEVMAPIDRHVAYQAKKVAEARKIQVSDYLSGLLRQVVDDDFKGI